MDTESSSIPVPVCELCWLLDNTIWEPESMDENGQVVMRMTGIAVPDKLNTGDVEVCGTCGGITISGIYEMREPSELPLLDVEDTTNPEDDDDYDPTSFRVNLINFYGENEDDEEDDEG